MESPFAIVILASWLTSETVAVPPYIEIAVRVPYGSRGDAPFVNWIKLVFIF